MVTGDRPDDGADAAGARARDLFLARVASLSRAQVLALGEAVGALVAEGADRRRTTKGYLFAWYEGPRISDAERFVFGAYFEEVLASLAAAVSGTDPRMLLPDQPRQSLTDAIAGIFMPRREWTELGEMASRLFERGVAPTDPRPIIVATWNAGAAVWMRGRLEPRLEAALTAPWRRAVGDLPT